MINVQNFISGSKDMYNNGHELHKKGIVLPPDQLEYGRIDSLEDVVNIKGEDMTVGKYLMLYAHYKDMLLWRLLAEMDHENGTSELILLDTANYKETGTHGLYGHNVVPGLGTKLFKDFINTADTQGIERIKFVASYRAVDFYSKVVGQLLTEGKIKSWHNLSKFGTGANEQIFINLT